MSEDYQQLMKINQKYQINLQQFQYSSMTENHQTEIKQNSYWQICMLFHSIHCSFGQQDP